MWRVKFSKSALKQLETLDNPVRQKILTYISQKLDNTSNPRLHGKLLTGKLAGYWRYRVEKYRIIAVINDNELTILLVRIGKRDNIYDKIL
ncbi:MAG: type II toxin-antitoxin system RelE/ParE family toxin [Candidatus Pacebacteria bacterium]|nr:type II toxin-antitoxin system RelE/ParE family toxin [Candidatus Paceibacterota bacterium]